MPTATHRLLASSHRSVKLRSSLFDKPAHDFFEQSWWHRSIIAAFVFDCPDVRSRPDKTIALGQDNPRSLVFKSQAPLGGRRDFNSILRIRSRRMRDR
ncbi:hypothetical protein ATN81_27720 [Agrobacterium pusense]|nr:hypothetical protein ATN81_27720 [Agrobacterium pusense]OJH56059.1 hypothetical protein BA725_29255 [Agrobacterium pusense]